MSITSPNASMRGQLKPVTRFVGRVRAGLAPFFTVIVLASIVVTSIVFHASVIFQHPYPPSGDAGGEVFAAHEWLGYPIPSQLTGTPKEVPVYIFLVVIPAINLLGTFQGVMWYVSLLPAFLAIPAYYLGRVLGLKKTTGLVLSLLVATSAAFSFMLSWGAGSNLFGILLLTFFLAELTLAFRTNKSLHILLTGAIFGLIAGSDPITLVCAALALVVSSLAYLALSRGLTRSSLKTSALVVCCSLLFASLFAPFYLSQHYVNVGVGDYLNVLGWFYSPVALVYPWGWFYSFTPNSIEFMDAGLFVAGALLLFLNRRTAGMDRAGFAVIVGAFASPMLFPMINASNAVRGLYFLTVPVMIVVCFSLEQYSAIFGKGSPISQRESLAATQSPRRVRRKLNRSTAIAMITPVATVAILAVNGMVSYQVLSYDVNYYESLTTDDVQALAWISANTPSSAQFYDAAGLQTWMWAYAQRSDFSATPLGSQVTKLSYDDALIADQIQMGVYLLENPYVTIANSPPDPVGTPQIYVAVPGYWQPLFGASGNSIALDYANDGGTAQVGLQYLINLTHASLSQGTSESQGVFDVRPTQGPWAATISESLNSSTYSISWTSDYPGHPIQYVTASFGMPPSGYFYNYANVPEVRNASSVSDSLNVAGSAFTMTISGGNLSQTVLPDGWTSLDYNGTGTIVFHFSGGSPFARNYYTPIVNSTELLLKNGIKYIVLDTNHGGYEMSLRIQSLSLVGLTPVRLFQAGTVFVYELEPAQ